MPRDVKLGLLFLVFVLVFGVLPILAFAFVSSRFGMNEVLQAQIAAIYTPIIGYMLGTQLVQMLFLRTVREDEPILDLVMPWGLGNLWDDPDKYFPAGWARWYRTWRICFHVGSFVLVVWLFVSNVVA